jgi:tetratricopeptide (TPR) repeat protein
MHTANSEPDSSLESCGVELANRGQYEAARKIFQEVLISKTVPVHRAQVLRNIMLTYEKEGNKQAAIEKCNEILEVPGLTEDSEGVYLHGQISGHVTRLQGRSVWNLRSLAGISGLFAAYAGGAAWGAAIGSKMQDAGHTIFGQAVHQDLRYGGACLGAIVGLFLFSRVMVAAGPALSIAAGIVCAAFTSYILLQQDVQLGFLILGNLVLLPIGVGSFLAWRFRNK